MKAALTDLNNAVVDLMRARDSLNEAKEKATTFNKLAEWEHHEYRISSTIAQIEHIQNAAAEFAPLIGQFRRFTSRHTDAVGNSAIFAVRGGIALVTATTFAADRFVQRLGKPERQITRQGLMGVASWLLTGNVLGKLHD